jgi:integrase
MSGNREFGLGQGLFSRTRKSGKCVFWGKAWVPSQGKHAYWNLGTSLPTARKRWGGIVADVEKAYAQQVAERSRRDDDGFGALVGEFLGSYRSRGGTRYYASVLQAPRAYFEDTPASSIDAKALDRYLLDRRSVATKGVRRKVDGKTVMVGAGRRKIGESTLRKECIALGTVFRWAKQRGLVQANPLADYTKPKEPGERHIAILATEQEDALLLLLPPLERDIAEWAIYTGMRRGEVLALSWPSIERASGVVHVVGTKTGKARSIPLNLSPKLEAILDRHPHRIGSPLLFHDQDGKSLDMHRLDGVLDGAATSAGIGKERGVLWNRFRHTFATRLAATGRVSLFEVSKWMGNSAEICEKHYAAYLPSSQERTAGLLDAPLGARLGARSGG